MTDPPTPHTPAVSTLQLPIQKLPDPLPLPHHTQLASGTITLRPPGSKSLTNRALILAALADSECTLTNPLTQADDARAMIACLRQLGVEIDQRPDRLTIRSPWALGKTAFVGGQTLDCRSAGTASRFLTAIACLADARTPPHTTITGSDQLKARPFDELVGLLRTIGVRIETAQDPPALPLFIAPLAQNSAETVHVPRTASSQFVSAVLMLGTRLPRALTIHFTEPPTSRAYVHMTSALLQLLGSTINVTPNEISVAAEPLAGFNYDVEADASGATYFLAADHLLPNASIEMLGVPADSLQGDANFPDALAKAIAGNATIDMTDMPDAAMTLGAFVAFADGPTTITGLRTLRDKECDRIAATKNELEKLGVRVEVFEHESREGAPDEGMTITPPEGGIDCSDSAPPVEFETYDDHRMAMSLALIALRRPNILIRDPGCVAKTYPSFWRDFARLYTP